MRLLLLAAAAFAAPVQVSRVAPRPRPLPSLSSPAITLSREEVWPALERALVQEAGAGERESRVEEWREAAARRLRDDPSEPLPKAMAFALAEVHAFDAGRRAFVEEILGARDLPSTADPEVGAFKRLFRLHDQLYAVAQLEGQRPVLYHKGLHEWRPVLDLPEHAEARQLLIIDAKYQLATSRGLLRPGFPSTLQAPGLPGSGPGIEGASVSDVVEFEGRWYAGTDQGVKVYVDGTWTDAGLQVHINALKAEDGGLVAFTSTDVRSAGTALDWQPISEAKASAALRVGDGWLLGLGETIRTGAGKTVPAPNFIDRLAAAGEGVIALSRFGGIFRVREDRVEKIFGREVADVLPDGLLWTAALASGVRKLLPWSQELEALLLEGLSRLPAAKPGAVLRDGEGRDLFAP